MRLIFFFLFCSVYFHHCTEQNGTFFLPFTRTETDINDDNKQRRQSTTISDNNQRRQSTTMINNDNQRQQSRMTPKDFADNKNNDKNDVDKEL